MSNDSVFESLINNRLDELLESDDELLAGIKNALISKRTVRLTHSMEDKIILGLSKKIRHNNDERTTLLSIKDSFNKQMSKLNENEKEPNKLNDITTEGIINTTIDIQKPLNLYQGKEIRFNGVLMVIDKVTDCLNGSIQLELSRKK